MVCQAASQTRFRALKHENGIEGEPTIIIRVIACFQPLHNCQVSTILLIFYVFQLQFFSFSYDFRHDCEACCVMKIYAYVVHRTYTPGSMNTKASVINYWIVL